MAGKRECTGWLFVASAIIVAALALPALPARAQEASALVSAEWLQRHLGRADLLLLDAQPPPLHRKAHIPGAVSVSVYSYAAREPSTADMQRLMRSWGVGARHTIVVYDQGGDMYAARLYFDLYLNGLPAERLKLLDGGMRRWQAIGGTVTAEPTPPPAAGDVDIAQRRDGVLARLPAVFAASGSADGADGAVLVDALSPDYYYGQTKFFDRAGHLPNARLLPREDFYDADGTFRSPEALRRMAGYHGIGAAQPIVTYCGGGIAAAVPWFALRFVAGYPQVSLYAGSQLDWLRDDRGLPMWTYAAPTMMRDAAWLATWGGRMLRGFGLSRISVVDVRDADAWRKGHVPASVNLPARQLVAHARDRDALAATFAQARVNPADEAVIVSTGGVDGDAALAFALLEHAGQHQVSLLLVSVDDWALRGLPLDKPAVAATSAAPAPVDAPYRAAESRDIIVRDAQAPGGAYATVVLESGRTPSATATPGALHVPYTALLDAGGKPKAAQDVWTILAKAGVPRHARVVCTADDPRDAAINYYMLRLMGWPDVKLLVR